MVHQSVLIVLMCLLTVYILITVFDRRIYEDMTVSLPPPPPPASGSTTSSGQASTYPDMSAGKTFGPAADATPKADPPSVEQIPPAPTPDKKEESALVEQTPVKKEESALAESTPEKSGLSTLAIVLIIIGSLLVVGVGGYLFYRWRKNSGGRRRSITGDVGLTILGEPIIKGPSVTAKF